MFLNDLGGDGEAEAGAAMLGGVKGQEEAFTDFVGESVASVTDGDLDGCAILSHGAVDAEDAEQAALHGFSSVVDEVGQSAADGFRVGHHHWQRRLEIPLHVDSLETTGEESEGFLGDLVKIAGTRLEGGELGESGELVDKGAQRANAAQNHLAALANDLWGVGDAAIEVAGDTLGGKRDGSERILDLVSDTLCDFLPCELTLSTK